MKGQKVYIILFEKEGGVIQSVFSSKKRAQEEYDYLVSQYLEPDFIHLVECKVK
ncbi:hypothetical protein [Priestia megaterium]|uniref:hypothetical protein n=1 Tax=Priestia megaterium TaxID=1404 RepID=UPI00196B73AB|nr:hypothetical protein [Priestia megaterium]QSF36956.1 hypothetical protein ICR96_15965 [Priestia megaterium]